MRDSANRKGLLCKETAVFFMYYQDLCKEKPGSLYKGAATILALLARCAARFPLSGHHSRRWGSRSGGPWQRRLP